MRELRRVFPLVVRILGRLAKDSLLPRTAKVALAAAVAYILSPVDLIPDFIPVAGILDDVLIAAVVIDGILGYVDRSIVLKYWPGDAASLDRIARIARWLSVWVPRGLKARIFSPRSMR
jgi:uncharacterized membrane protein YkvA (DUF1232 family)